MPHLLFRRAVIVVRRADERVAIEHLLDEVARGLVVGLMLVRVGQRPPDVVMGHFVSGREHDDLGVAAVEVRGRYGQHACFVDIEAKLDLGHACAAPLDVAHADAAQRDVVAGERTVSHEDVELGGQLERVGRGEHRGCGMGQAHAAGNRFGHVSAGQLHVERQRQDAVGRIDVDARLRLFDAHQVLVDVGILVRHDGSFCIGRVRLDQPLANIMPCWHQICR